MVYDGHRHRDYYARERVAYFARQRQRYVTALASCKRSNARLPPIFAFNLMSNKRKAKIYLFATNFGLNTYLFQIPQNAMLIKICI